MLKPIDIRNAFIGNPELLNWILYQHYVFADDIDTPAKNAMHKWGIKLLKLIAPKDKLSAVEFLKRAIMTEKDSENAEV